MTGPVAAIDCGTNAIRLLVADVDAEGAGRMHGGAADWETGALLLTLPPGDFRVSSAPAECAA